MPQFVLPKAVDTALCVRMPTSVASHYQLVCLRRWLWSLKNVPCSPITWATVMYLPRISLSHHPGCHTNIYHKPPVVKQLRQYNEGSISFEGADEWKQQIFQNRTLQNLSYLQHGNWHSLEKKKGRRLLFFFKKKHDKKNRWTGFTAVTCTAKQWWTKLNTRNATGLWLKTEENSKSGCVQWDFLRLWIFIGKQQQLKDSSALIKGNNCITVIWQNNQTHK